MKSSPAADPLMTMTNRVSRNGTVHGRGFQLNVVIDIAYLVSASWLARVGRDSGWTITNIDLRVYCAWYGCT